MMADKRRAEEVDYRQEREEGSDNSLEKTLFLMSSRILVIDCW
jgi:hypothetical protein